MNTAIVIFGASGDLAARKLIPALYNNFRKQRLPGDTSITGISRTAFSAAAFCEKMKTGVKENAPETFDEATWSAFARRVAYHAGDLGSGVLYDGLRDRLLGGDQPSNLLFYCAVSPDLFPVILRHLAAAGLLTETPDSGFRRVIIEKPFGDNLDSARMLNRELHAVLREDQVYRIDHYLGKETVQNVFVFRFGNAIFEPIWNRNYIDHVQITVAETLGVGHRAQYYDHMGALRDMFQNHLLQLLALVAMEPPSIFEANALRNEKVKVFRALREIAPEQSSRFTARGQYAGYRAEPGVDPSSDTETFAAVQCYIDNWRWQGVPFYLRSGKKLAQKISRITIQFRRPPTQILDVAAGKTELFTNHLSLNLQPDEGIRLHFLAKIPDQGLRTKTVDMDFSFRDSFKNAILPEAYERLLLDALQGDASLFARSDEIEFAWTFVDRIRDGWQDIAAAPLVSYPAGSWGPGTSDMLPGREGRWWVEVDGTTSDSR